MFCVAAIIAGAFGNLASKTAQIKEETRWIETTPGMSGGNDNSLHFLP